MSSAPERAILGPVQENKGGSVIDQPRSLASVWR